DTDTDTNSNKRQREEDKSAPTAKKAKTVQRIHPTQEEKDAIDIEIKAFIQTHEYKNRVARGERPPLPQEELLAACRGNHGQYKDGKWEDMDHSKVIKTFSRHLSNRRKQIE